MITAQEQTPQADTARSIYDLRKQLSEIQLFVFLRVKSQAMRKSFKSNGHNIMTVIQHVAARTAENHRQEPCFRRPVALMGTVAA